MKVQIDDTGVYHGHSAGVTKYTLLEGQPVWHMNTEDGVLHGVQVRRVCFSKLFPSIWCLTKTCKQEGLSVTSKIPQFRYYWVCELFFVF